MSADHESKPMRPTIKTIATLAGVSRGTVDRVLNNRPNVSPDKHEKVLEAIRKLNYKPNIAARTLALNNKKVRIGVLTPPWTGHFLGEVTRGLDAAAEDFKLYGVELVSRRCETNTPDDFIAALDAMLGQDVKGIALCAVNSMSVREKVREIVSAGIPVVTFNSDITDSGRVCFVGQDIRKAGVIAAGLMERMTRPEGKILIAAGNLEFAGHRERVDGFHHLWHGLGRSSESCLLIQTFNDYDVTFQKVRAALAGDDAICGVYMANDSVPACVEAIGSLALSRRIRVVAHDLSPEHRELLLYGAVDFVIGQDIFYQGHRPIELLAGLIDGVRPERDVEKTGVHIITAESVI